ncbi:MAG: RluA family pseudouridine synthase [Clostridia bacterium]|jgi:pseudouridine synthase, rluA family
MKKLVVNKKYDNKKLDKFLKDNISTLSNNLFYKTLRKKDIKINGKRVSENVTVFENDEILVYIPDYLLENKLNLDIIYEDNNILLINKPSNIEVTGQDSLTEVVHKLYSSCEFKPMPCHRLDRNTSGLILFAKNTQALEILLDKFKHHEIEKHYLALVYGIPQKKNERLISYLFKDSSKSFVYISDVPKKGYQKIITSYSLIESFDNNTSLLDIEIETGRTHQIRAHLAHIGLPIIGDGKYGINEINKRFKVKAQKLVSYKLIFRFEHDSKILEYLNRKSFELKNKNI